MKKGLNNPALMTVLNTPTGQKILEKGADSAFSILKGLQILLLTGVVGIGGYFVYKKIVGNFKKTKEDPNSPPANISDLAAKIKADAIYKALYGIGYDFKSISFALLKVNKNGFIKIYNAFGKRKGADFSESDLVEWLVNELKPQDVNRLRFITNNAF